MRRGHELDDDAAALDPLDRQVPRVHAELFADRFLDRHLATLANGARHTAPPDAYLDGFSMLPRA